MSDSKITRIYPDRSRRKRNLILRVLSLIVLVALVIGAVALVLFWDDMSLDGLRRFIKYLNVSQSEADGRFSYDQHSSNVYVAAGSGLAVASVGGLTLYDDNGDALYTVSSGMSSPAVSSGDDVTIAYDIGGTSLLAVSASHGVTAEITTGGALLDADISAGDTICYCAVEDGVRTVLTVLDDSQQEIYKWRSSSSYLTPCAVSENGSQAVAVSIGQSAHTYESTLLLFDTASQDAPASVSLGDLLVYDLDYVSDTVICAIGETEAVFVQTDGTLAGRYDYSTRYLKDFAFGGDGFLVLSLNEYQAGSRYSIATVDAATLEVCEVYIGAEILSISASGGYLAVLTVDGLTVYTGSLERYAGTADTGSATRVLMRPDGTALLLSGSTASLFIP